MTEDLSKISKSESKDSNQEISIQDKTQNSSNDKDLPQVKKPPKPPKPEDKPFEEFINTELIPSLTNQLKNNGLKPVSLTLLEGERPVVGGLCWMMCGEINNNRRFWLCFNDKNITSQKTISLAECGSEPSILESFLIDEKKTTLALIISRILQRLNGQKWLGEN